MFLQKPSSLYQNHLDEKAAMEAWCGPDGAHQDFIFGNTAVEVKSLSGRERSTVRISSEDQLESLCDDLFLVVISVFIGLLKINEEYKFKEKIYKFLVLILFLIGIFMFSKSLEMKFFTASAAGQTEVTSIK